MAAREGPNMMMSFLDLLLSALGGVALLMMLFAAIQTQNAEAARRLESEIVSVELLTPAGSALDALVIGEEIGLAVETADGFASAFGEPPALPPSPLVVRWEEARRRRYRFVLQSAPESEPVLRLWLRAHDPERAAAFVAAARDGLRLEVAWTGMEDEPRQVALDAPGSFYTTVEIR